MSAKRGGLGTNLDALIPTSLTVGGNEVAQQNEVSIDSISPNPKQPRTVFNEEAMAELVASIKEIGILQPPVVRQTSLGRYELVMGERRFRAAKLAGLRSIPVIIRQTPDNELLREALIENIHRSQLNPLEEAAAYTQLLQDFNCTHDELAHKLGRSRPLISNTMRLLNLPASVQSRVASGVISAGHARALLGLSNEAQIDQLAKRIVAEGLSVRAVEEIIAATSPKSASKAKKKSGGTSPEVNEIAEQLGDHLDTRVKIKGGKTKGEISIEFSGYADLARIIKKIKG
jgi:ParB family transcriptional regulator, chromosome partitioning protein|uniref:ParB/RepB/Spo0J family partition protein n=1 Tax=Candidatus Planktophila sp. TaxID=2175601 RepID=UPI004049365A